ncbi:MAG: hypothetical protein ACLQE9_17150 [Roseiarcus sp.]
MPITTIQEIIVMKPITRIPQVPASIEGCRVCASG